VSLSDIVQFVGTSSVPVVVAGTVLGVFELGEKLASQRAKDALSNWLLTFDVRQAGALPDGTREIFERIFGERHFSLKCFLRSAAFSVGAMAFISILLLLIAPTKFSANFFAMAVELSLWLPWSILIDYFSLFKTRLILGILTRINNMKGLISVCILLLDYFIYRVIFVMGTAVVFIGGLFHEKPDLQWGLDAIFAKSLSLFPSAESQVTVYFWAGFAPSIWMWLYVAALFVTRALLRSERILNWLRWCLDVEKAPFRSIGAVAAALAFIASVAIILISAEVAWIRGAT
jgi:hypothetical protein